MGLRAVPALTGVENQADLTSERETLWALEQGRGMSQLVGCAQTNLDIILRGVQVLVNLSETTIHIPQQNHAKGRGCAQHSYTKEKSVLKWSYTEETVIKSFPRNCIGIACQVTEEPRRTTRVTKVTQR